MTRTKAKGKSARRALNELSQFPLLSAILGRRSRRFPMGGKISGGPFEYQSKSEPLPLSDLETALVTSLMVGNTGWNNLIPFNAKCSPRLPNYAGTAAGRVFPSAAGFHTTELFYTDDSGIYFLSTKDTPALKRNGMSEDFEIDGWVANHKALTRKISAERLVIPSEEPYVDGHNIWIANAQGSLFAIPVADVAQHSILGLCYLAQNGYALRDDIHNQNIPGVEKFSHLVNTESLYAISYFDQIMFGECTVELATSCFTGALLLQAMGLGGWMYDGIDRHTVLGMPDDPKAPGLGFQSQTDPQWATPNPVGIKGVFECHCPPFFKNMAEAVDHVIERKFKAGGPFHEATGGPFKNNAKMRTAAECHSEEFRELIVTQAQYIFDRFGKFPATTPSAYSLMYLQAQHIDLEYYDRFYDEGAYLNTHAHHHRNWHT